MTLSLGQLEGKYEVLHKIQEGGMGAVYKVRHLLLDQVRVVKVIRPQFANDESLQRRFRHEAKTAIRLRHTNLVELYDFVFDDADGTSFMVMEFIDGVTVEDALARQGALPAGLVIEVARQCLDALAYLHGMGLLHRDVSPDNLMLTRGFGGRPRVKLIDLGIVKHVAATTGVTRTGSFVGKIRYASPEAFAGADVRPDERADLYSLGVVLYEALTGVHPIGGNGFSEIASAHMFKPPLPFEQSDPEGRVPPGLQRVVLKALEKAPDGRFADAEVMHAALLPFAAEPAELERLFERALDAPAAPGSAPDAGPAAAAPGPAPPRSESAVPSPAAAPAWRASARQAMEPFHAPSQASEGGSEPEIAAAPAEAPEPATDREAPPRSGDEAAGEPAPEARRRAGAGDSLAAADWFLGRGALASAASHLSAAERAEPDRADVQDLRRRLLTARRLQQIDALLAAGHQQVATGQLLRAHQTLRRLQRLAPDLPEAEDLFDRWTAARREREMARRKAAVEDWRVASERRQASRERRRSRVERWRSLVEARWARSLAFHAWRVDKLVEAGRLEEAGIALERAQAGLGPFEPWEGIEEKLVEQWQARRQARR